MVDRITSFLLLPSVNTFKIVITQVCGMAWHGIHMYIHMHTCTYVRTYAPGDPTVVSTFKVAQLLLYQIPTFVGVYTVHKYIQCISFHPQLKQAIAVMEVYGL